MRNYSLISEGIFQGCRDALAWSQSAHTGRAAAFFDVDRTVVAKPAMVAFARPLYQAGLINRRLVARAAWNHLRFRYLPVTPDQMARFRRVGTRIVTGWDAAEVRAIVTRSLPEVLAPFVYDEAVALMRLHQRVGRPVYLVSAEPREVVEPLVEFLGLDGALASEAAIDDEGRYTGETRAWLYGPHKARAMTELAGALGIDLAVSYAYSDAATDLPMLEAVGNPVCVNPDRALSGIAAARCWQTLRFRRTRASWRARRPSPTHTP
ncbi:MAG: HAD-IB family hydrolase [Acidimicrobiales bacterium]|nr:HAD-IB family hydrolase [Acidimicrobiales bacterium]